MWTSASRHFADESLFPDGNRVPEIQRDRSVPEPRVQSATEGEEETDIEERGAAEPGAAGTNRTIVSGLRSYCILLRVEDSGRAQCGNHPQI